MTASIVVLRRWPRVAYAVTMATLCALAIVYQYDVRLFEAKFAAAAIGLFGDTSSVGTTVYAWLGMRNAIGLNITAECTVAVLALPVFITVSLLAWRRYVSMGRLTVAAVVGVAVVFAGNQLRLLAIAFSTRWWGTGFGFDFAHNVTGSVISLVTACVGVVVVLWIGTRYNNREG